MRTLFFIICAFILVSATNPSWLSQRSTIQMTHVFTSYDAVYDAQSFIKTQYRDGYRVVSCVATSTESGGDNKVLVIMEK